MTPGLKPYETAWTDSASQNGRDFLGFGGLGEGKALNGLE